MLAKELKIGDRIVFKKIYSTWIEATVIEFSIDQEMIKLKEVNDNEITQNVWITIRDMYEIRKLKKQNRKEDANIER